MAQKKEMGVLGNDGAGKNDEDCVIF